jgi:tetratricopeptide (TPR) repeat protein
MKCNSCGLESDIPEAFVTRRRWVGLVTRRYCPACWEKMFLREQLESLTVLGGFLAVLDALVFHEGALRLTVDILFFVLVNFPVIVAHELSHAAACQVLGVRVFKVIIGFGRKLFSLRAADITWELHLWPFGGGTLLGCPPKPGRRARLFGAVLAGPAMNFALMIPTVFLLYFFMALQDWLGVDTAVFRHWTLLFLLINGLLLLLNLIPWKGGSAFGQAGTDGWQLLHLLLQQPEVDSARTDAYYIMETMNAMERGEYDAALRWAEQGLAAKPDQPVLRLLRGNLFIKQRRFTEARDVYTALLATEEGNKPYFRYNLYNNIAYADVLVRNPELLPEADRYSEEALRQTGWEAGVIGTRGLVLVELGRLEEGIRLLKQSLERTRDDAGKASEAYHLGVGERRRGNHAESNRYFELARKLDPRLYLWGFAAEEKPVS